MLDIPAAILTGLTAGPHNAWLLNPETAVVKMMELDSSARDAGSTPTTLLRSGLVLGLITATKKVMEYNGADNDGTETAIGILLGNAYLVDPFGGALTSTMFVPVVIQGRVRSQTTDLYGIDAAAIVELRAQGFIIEEDLE